MTKAELIAAVAEKTELSKKDSEKAVVCMIETIMGVVSAGEKVTFTGFGSFEAVTRAERNGVNPSTGEKIVIPAKKIPKFKAGKYFKELCE